MQRHTIDAVMGMVVLVVAGFFLFTLVTAGKQSLSKGNPYYAYFQSVNGLHVGTDIRVGGVKVGAVTGLHLDNQRYQARVDVAIDAKISLADDSQLQILSDGLMGGAYLDLTLGKSNQSLSAGQELKKTNDAVALEDLLGRAIFLVSKSAE